MSSEFSDVRYVQFCIYFQSQIFFLNIGRTVLLYSNESCWHPQTENKPQCLPWNLISFSRGPKNKQPTSKHHGFGGFFFVQMHEMSRYWTVCSLLKRKMCCSSLCLTRRNPGWNSWLLSLVLAVNPLLSPPTQV